MDKQNSCPVTGINTSFLTFESQQTLKFTTQRIGVNSIISFQNIFQLNSHGNVSFPLNRLCNLYDISMILFNILTRCYHTPEIMGFKNCFQYWFKCVIFCLYVFI